MLGLVRRLRVVLPLAILAFVVAHQAAEAMLLPAQANGARFLSGVLVYGLIGPLVTWRTLTWIAERLERQSAAEARARRGERFLAAIASGSADAILGLDTDGVVRSWSRGAQEILGYEEEEVVGMPATQLMPPSLQPGDGAVIGRMLAERGYLRGVQARCRHKDGRVVPVDLTQTVVRGDAGEALGSSVILRDMSGRIEAERAVLKLNRDLEARVVERTRQLEAAGATLRERNEALQVANRELEELDALKDEFVALVSHELRAPLTNVQASAELLLLVEEDPKKRQKLEIVGQEAQRLAKLVRGVLDASRMRAGRFTVKPGPVDPGRLVDEAVGRLGPDDSERVVVAVPATVPWVLADGERMVEVLDNLIANALKYSPHESKIQVAVGSDPTTDGYVRFSIRDEGIGIPPEETERIFDRFHRVERGDARETYGHGLGLYIARQIVEAHDGRLGVDSRPGEGSTFAFHLPAAPEE